MAFLSHVIAQASGGRCQPWTEEIRYMKGRGMRKENKEAEEGRKGAGKEGGVELGFTWHFPAISSGPPPKAT